MSLKIDGIATNGALDSSGEILSVQGIEISDLVEGRGYLNWEHQNDSPEDILGSIVYAKKIMKESDAENDRQREYWKQSKGPYVYIIAELFDDEEHPGAVAAGALIRYYAKRKERLMAGFSIEGQTLDREDNFLKRSVGRRVAFTLKPCNKACIADILHDQKQLKDTVEKSANENTKILTVEVDDIIFNDPIEAIKADLANFEKTLTVTHSSVAPEQLTSGAALTPEHRQKRLKNALSKWDRKRPLKEFLKATLPEMGDQFIDHFATLADELTIKKNMGSLIRADESHSDNKLADTDQKRLITGLYFDPASDPFKESESAYTFPVQTLVNDDGQRVDVKYFDENDKLDAYAKNAANYYSLARHFFGLGEHVPVTNYVKDPQGRHIRRILAKENLQGAKTLFDNGADKDIEAARKDGSAHKLAIMDMILGHSGARNASNVVIGSDGKIKHTDNDRAFEYNHSERPHHLHRDQDVSKDIPDVPTSKWVQSLNKRTLLRLMKLMDIDDSRASKAVISLEILKKLSAEGRTIGDMAKQLKAVDEMEKQQ